MNEEMNLFDMSDDSTLDVFEAKKSANDGIYRPKLDDAADKTKGYRAVLRFLPNLTPDGKMGAFAIEKHVHYANIQANQTLSGYYDCAGGKECPLCAEYWKLYNSKNAADNERAKLISRTTKYYSYVLVIEDKQHPEWEGKIMIFPYGKQISKKIQEERKGEITDDPCNVFRIDQGKDFVLLIKEKSNFPTYEFSAFRPNKTSVKIMTGTGLKNAPLDENDKISDPKVQKAISTFLLERDVTLEDNAPKAWTDADKGKVADIVATLEGKQIVTEETDDFGEDTMDGVPEGFGDDAEDTDSFFNLED